jgi:hypothetical protein
MSISVFRAYSTDRLKFSFDHFFPAFSWLILRHSSAAQVMQREIRADYGQLRLKQRGTNFP